MVTTWHKWWLPRNTAQPLKRTWKKLQEGHNEISIYSITEWKLCRYRWKRWTRSVATLLLHCSSMDREERVQAPPNALGNAVEQRASTDCRTTRELGLPEKWEMVQGTNYAENCRRARTHMRSAPKMKLHEKCVKLSSALSDGEQCNCSGESWFCWRPQHAKSVCKRLLDFSTDSISSEFKNIFHFIHVYT